MMIVWIGYFTSDSIGIVKINHVKDIRLYILPHLVECGAIKPRAGKSVVNVFLDEYMTGCDDLLSQCEHLTLDGAFLRLQVSAHTRVQRRSLHIR
jgi:hypothetical protein